MYVRYLSKGDCIQRGAHALLHVVGFACALVLLLPGASIPSRASEPHTAQTLVALSVTQSGHAVTLSNGFVQLTFDRASLRVTHLSADHSGQGDFRTELLAPGGITFDDAGSDEPATVQSLHADPMSATVVIGWTARSERLAAHVTFHLDAGERGVHIAAVIPGNSTAGVRVMLRQWFLLGIFNKGVVQYVAGQDESFSSISPLRLFYTLDRTNGSVALEPDTAKPDSEVTLLSGAATNESGIVFRSRITTDTTDVWRKQEPVTKSPAQARPNLRISFTLYANDLPYPAHRDDSRVDGLNITQTHDLTAYFASIYGSAAGILGSYIEPGSAYPTLAHPKRAYGKAFNFFDPDSWEVVTTLAYSGDPLLQNEARKVLERSEAAQRSDGQIPHHFEDGRPTFLSIAGSSQTGPNIFWTLAAIQYAMATGDEEWLHLHYAHLRMATDWVLSRYNPQMQLVRADGPLFIDVFRRSGFTLDTNVFAYHLLGEMSDVAAFCNDEKTAIRYQTMRKTLRAGILRKLWNGRDHFITERHADGTARDFVDYDGNFAALAFGILPDGPNARRLLERLDRGPHTHPGGYGTWVSERRYEKQDCYKGNDGDSDVAMARIWWLDMAARVQMDDSATFSALFNKIEHDILQNVWMPERFDAEGRPAHNSYYHEYPEVWAMALRELRYGVRVTPEKVAIRPFGVRGFSLHLGNLRVDYSPVHVLLLAPGSNERTVTLAGLLPVQRYVLSTGERLTADAQGTLSFRAKSGIPLTIVLEK